VFEVGAQLTSKYQQNQCFQARLLRFKEQYVAQRLNKLSLSYISQWTTVATHL